MNEVHQILSAEDNPRDVELTLLALEAAKMANEIVVVSDGEEALDYLYQRGRFNQRATGSPAQVLLDLTMPKVDGLKVLRAIKQDPALQLIPVLIPTSSREEQDLVRSYHLGVNAYVVKPVYFKEFVEAVRQLGVFWTIHNQLPSGRGSFPDIASINPI